MKYLILTLAASLMLCGSVLTSSAKAGELSLTVGQSKLNHQWIGPVNYTDFNLDMTTVGVSYTTDSGWGGSFLYGKGGKAETLGRHSDLVLEMEYILSYEIFYKYSYERFSVFGGVGYYVIPSATRSKNTGISDNDQDNDHGFFYGAGYKLTDNVTVSYRVTNHSWIEAGGYKEWTRSQGAFLTRTF